MTLPGAVCTIIALAAFAGFLMMGLDGEKQKRISRAVFWTFGLSAILALWLSEPGGKDIAGKPAAATTATATTNREQLRQAGNKACVRAFNAEASAIITRRIVPVTPQENVQITAEVRQLEAECDRAVDAWNASQ
jgi:uncharacterized protein YhfF